MPIRRLMTKGLYNARDLGGFPAKDGLCTRFGVFVRSEAPVGLSDEDIQYLEEYGVRASMDFRSSGETWTRPSDLSTRMTYYLKPLFNEAAVVGDRKPEKKPPIHDWGIQYISMAEESREWAKDVLRIAAEQEGALLYHCTTGKDRTGLMTCYLLSIAGVAPEDIAADYCVSQIYLEPVFEKMRAGTFDVRPPQENEGAGNGAESGEPQGPPQGGPPMDEGFFQTPASAMFTVMNYLRDTYGGVVEYLRKIGVSEEIMEKIRRKFLQNP